MSIEKGTWCRGIMLGFSLSFVTRSFAWFVSVILAFLLCSGFVKRLTRRQVCSVSTQHKLIARRCSFNQTSAFDI